MQREEILRRLSSLDREASIVLGRQKHYKMILLGGSALVLQRWVSRSTIDIDAVSVPQDLIELMGKYDINMRAEAFFDHIPYNYEDRLVPLSVGGKVIDYYTLSLEDLVVTKLCSIRDTDWRDTEEKSVINNLDWNLLETLATNPDELQASIGSDREYSEFLGRYHNYKEKYYEK